MENEGLLEKGMWMAECAAEAEGNEEEGRQRKRRGAQVGEAVASGICHAYKTRQRPETAKQIRRPSGPEAC